MHLRPYSFYFFFRSFHFIYGFNLRVILKAQLDSLELHTAHAFIYLLKGARNKATVTHFDLIRNYTENAVSVICNGIAT